MIPQPRFYYDKQNTSRDPSIIKTSWLSWFISYEHQPGMSKGGSMSQRWGGKNAIFEIAYFL